MVMQWNSLSAIMNASFFICGYFKKPGHEEFNCINKVVDTFRKENNINTNKNSYQMKNDVKEPKEEDSGRILSVIGDESQEKDAHLWVIDSGATNHITNSMQGLSGIINREKNENSKKGSRTV